MEARTISKGLALFSLGLGLAELVVPRKIGASLGADRQRDSLIRGFGAREVAAGIGILQAPDEPSRVLARVAGDVLDIAALASLSRGDNGRKGWVWGAILAVAGVTIADFLTAGALSSRVGSDREKDQASNRAQSSRRSGRISQQFDFTPDFKIEDPQGAASMVTFKPDLSPST